MRWFVAAGWHKTARFATGMGNGYAVFYIGGRLEWEVA